MGVKDSTQNEKEKDIAIAIFCPAHRGVFMAKLSDIEGKEEITCSVCGAKLIFTVKDPLTATNMRLLNLINEFMEKTLATLEEELDFFFKFHFDRDWGKRRKNF